jgi:hypothetical protein
MKRYLIIVMFFCIGAFFVISNYNIHLNSPDGPTTFFKQYYSWLNNVVNYAKGITAFVFKTEWVSSQNSSLTNQQKVKTSTETVEFSKPAIK